MFFKIRKFLRPVVLLLRRIRFHLLFRQWPPEGGYSNAKRIVLRHSPARDRPARDYLVFIRSGGAHGLVDDGADRSFDIALNLFAGVPDDAPCGYDYLIAGGLNKYKAAYRFLDASLIERYAGCMFLDDDLEISCSELDRFLHYCTANHLQLAQPSLSRDSCYSHSHVVNTADAGSRSVALVEVMCPFFSRAALKAVLPTFDLSYSTWGLDYLWPALVPADPVVVDAFTIRHTRPVSHRGEFYRYMSRIGISPQRELEKLKRRPLHSGR